MPLEESLTPQRRISLKRVVNGLGSLLTLAALGFVIYKLADNRVWELNPLGWPALIGLIVLGGVLYAGCVNFLTAAWARLLRWGGAPADFWGTLIVYGRSIVLKYIPGNIVQYPARHLIGRQLGYGDLALGAAAVLEMVGLLVTAGMITLGWVASGGTAVHLPLWGVAALTAGGAALVLLGLKIAPRFAVFAPLAQQPQRETARAFGAAVVFYGLYFCGMGLILWLVVRLTGGAGAAPTPGWMIAVFSITWLVGFITPGAPAGAGVREALMVLLLSPVFPEGLSLFYALVMRVITLGGDVLYFFIARLVQRRRGMRAA